MADPLRAAVRNVLRLALGRPAWAVADWPLLFEVARAERLLGIAWLRSGPLIRAAAPASLVASWRAAALALDQRARAQLETLVKLNELLAAHDVHATVLKGPPLSVRLYNEVGARQSVDVDLLVSQHARAVVCSTLEAAGWIRWLGEAPWDECFYRRHGEQVEYLEMHSLLPGEALSHCGPLRVEGEPFASVAGVVDVACGSALPVYLAGNLAKHGVLALSALVDFLTLWASLEAADREAAMKIARACGLLRCLRWAIAQAELLAEAAEGRPGALRDLGLRTDSRRFGHAYLRLMRLADNPLDAARIAAAWVWPRSSRGSWRGLGTVWNRRLHKPLSEVGSFRQSYVGS